MMKEAITSLDDWRTARSDDVLRCDCGSEWFRLTGHDEQPPAVTLNHERSITAYAGNLVCNACGTRK